MKTYFTLLISLCLVIEAQAGFPGWYLDYDSINDKATLVVVATPTMAKPTTNQMSFGTIKYGDSEPKRIMGTGIETSFSILTVLKGDRNTKELVLRHFALANPDSHEVKDFNSDFMGPGLISFEPNSKKLYLMFLQKELDGRYVAVTGQEDPVFSVKQLNDNDEPFRSLAQHMVQKSNEYLPTNR